jgi:RHS repeat-associated protein
LTDEIVSGLNAGSSYTKTSTINLPLNSSWNDGSYYLLLQTDREDRQQETDKSNNIKALNVAISVPPTPDLVVTQISAPSREFSGQRVQISWQVKNQGAVAATGTWIDRLFLGNNNALDNPTKVSFGDYAFTGTIAAGQTITRIQEITLPIDWSGDRWISVQTDATGTIYEHTAESNNTTIAASPIIVELSPFPNLQITSVTAPATAFAGQQTTVRWTVSNTGSGATNASAWSDQVWLSLDATIDAGDILLGSLANLSYLNPGESYTNSLDVTFPEKIAANYYFLVKTDAGNQVYEFNKEIDNLGVSNSVDIKPILPIDLQVTKVTAPLQVFSGQNISLNWQVTNEGLNKTKDNATWYDDVFISQDNVLDNSDRNLGRFLHNSIASLNPGESYTNTQRVSLPVGISGDYYFFVRTDSTDTIYERGYELNNVGVNAVPTNVNLTPPPDLEVESVTTTATNIRAGQSLTIDYQVTNNGSTITPNYTWDDSFYLSIDNQLDTATDLKIGSLTHSGVLDIGENYQGKAIITLPNGIEGTYYVLVKTDATSSVFELNKTNNIAAATQPIVVISRPADLIVSISSDNTAEAGKFVKVDWTVTNQGSGDTIAINWQDQIIASQDSILGNADDILLCTFNHNGLLITDRSYTQSQSIALPFGLVGGYNLFVRSDSSNSVYEAANESNNTAVTSLNVTRQTPDLQVTQAFAPTTAVSGGNLTVNWTVQNLGVGKTNSNYWYDNIYLSADGVIDSNDLLLGAVLHTNALDALGQYSATKSFDLPIDLTGNFRVIVRTDSASQVIEGANEDNNTAIAGTTNIAQGNTPNLVAVSVGAPPTQAIGGQPVNITWNVRNDGAADIASNRTWSDTVYLSRDQIFDRATDLVLGYQIHQGGLAIGQTYSQTTAFDLPAGLSGRYYVFVEIDSNQQIYEYHNEGDNVTFNPNATQIVIPDPADLSAGNITLPTNAVLGRDATIGYTVNNTGLNPARGTWNDSIYLSADDKWDATDILIKRVEHTGDIASGSSYTNTFTAPIPGVLPGDYHVIVRSDSRNQVRETDETNNITVSAGLVTVDAQILALDTTVTGVLAQGQSAYYRIDVKAGETLQVKLDSLAAGGANELYVRYGGVPSRSEFDYGFSDAFSADQQVFVPTTRGGTYYVLAYGNGVATPSSFELSAKTLDLSILGLNNNHGSNLGQTTIGIDGAKFSANAEVSLIAADGSTRIAQNVRWKNSTELWANFDLRGLNPGDYDVQVRDRGKVTTLNDSFTVNTGIAGRVDTRLVLPTAVRPGQVVEFSVEYTNIGETDVVAPLLSLSIENGKVKLPYDTDFNTSNFQFLAISDEGPAGTLAPGATGRVTFLLKPTGGGGAINIKLNPISEQQLIDWPTLGSDPNVDTTISRNFAEAVGNNFATYQAVLADNASYLSLLGDRTNDVTRLLAFEAQQAIGGIDREKAVGVFGHSWSFLGTVRADLNGNGEVVISGGLGQLLSAQLTGTTIDSNSRSLSVEQFLPVSGTPNEYRFLLQSDGTYTNAGSKLVKIADRYELTNLDGAKYVFRADGQVDYTEDVNGYRVTAVYTGNLLTGYTSSRGDRIDITYNSQQRIESITDRVGNTVTFGYDATGAYLKTIASPTINNTFSYDDPDRLDVVSKITSGDGSSITYDYDSHGRLHQLTTGQGGSLTYTYDSAGGQTVTDATGAKSTVLRNDLGQVARTIDALGNVTQYFYDGLGRISRVIDAQNLETSYVYDYRGNVIKTIDPDGREVKYAYTADRNLLESFTDSRGNTTRYKYDALGQLQTITYADNSKESFGYDAFGLIQTTDRSNRANTAIYNSNYQLTQQTYADGSAINYTYDPTTGQLTAITDNTGSTTIDYDLLNRHYSIAYANGRSVEYTYNNAGNITQLTQNGTTANYLYDANGRLDKLTDSSGNLIIDYTYDNIDRLVREDRGNGTYTTYTYDFAGQVLSLVNHAANGTLNSSFTYTYNAVGQRTTMTTLDGSWSYSYDGIGQLTNAVFASTNANIASQDLTYVYDAAGNRVKTIENGLVSNYQTNNLNEYTGAGTTTFGYDTKGNIISKQTGSKTWTYTYNDRAQLVRVSDTDNNLTTYEYDALGNRSASVYNDDRTEYLVDPSGWGNVLAEYDGSGNLKAQYTHGLGLISQKVGSDTAFYDFDALGSTADVTSSTGAIVNQYSYNPFGTNIFEVETRSNTFEYVGKYGVAEEANGLSFMRTRFYDGEIGRFTSPDTIGYQGGDTNLYRYVGNSPTNFIDPEGTYLVGILVEGAKATVLLAVANPVTAGVITALVLVAIIAVNSRQPNGNVNKQDGENINQIKNNIQQKQDFLKQGANPTGTGVLVASNGDLGNLGINFPNPNNNNPSNPNNPNSPTNYNPFDPNSPLNPTNPTSPLNPNNPTSPLNPNNPNSPFSPVNPTNPNSPLNPNNTNSPLNPNNPNNPFNPNNPNSPFNPNSPLNPNNPNNPFNPNNPNSPFNPNNPNNPFGPNGIIPIIRSRDPNDIAGPKGFGAEHWISAKDTLPYTIQFENAADATAPVHEVRITQQLDSDLDWRSFRVGSFGWGDLYFNVPSNKAFYNERLDLTAKLGFYVDVVAGVNAQTGEAFWTLTAIDPATGEMLNDAEKGFLPPNTQDDIGQGFINYTIRTNKNVANGATIDAKAQIFFDDNEPIDTPEYINTIDTGKPTSSINPLALTTEDTNIALSWSGNDNSNGSAIASYTVYVSIDGGTYTPWLENTTLTDATYIGTAGRSYAFYSIAKDNVGNIETAPTVPQAITSIISPGILTFSQSEYQVREDGTAVQAITIARTNGSKGTIGATIELTGGSATATDDFNSTPIDITFADGELVKTIFIPVVDDSLAENAETLNLRLTNITGGGKIGERATATLTILDNIAPTITSIVKPALIREGQAVDFTATAIDPDLNETLTYSWNFGDNTQPVIGRDATHTFVDNGNYNVILTVTDRDGVATTQTTTVTVDNVAPTVVAITKPAQINEGQSVAFTATATDVGANDTLTYSWNFGDNTQPVLGRDATHTFADNGNYNVVLTVTDKDGAVTTQTTAVTVDNVAPTIVSIVKPDRINEGESVAFTATGNDVGANDTLTYSWDFGDNTAPAIGRDVNHIFADNGDYNIILTLTDKDGAVTQQSIAVTVDNVAPTIVNIVKPDLIQEGREVQFTTLANDAGVNDTLTYSWNFGDNSEPIIGRDVTYTFADNGNYSVILKQLLPMLVLKIS